jgi:hypothetical protein
MLVLLNPCRHWCNWRRSLTFFFFANPLTTFFFYVCGTAYEQALVQLASIPHLSAREAEEVLKAALLARGATAAPLLSGIC